MPTPTKGPRLGAGPAHERLMLANLATSLFTHDRITTTEAKAKRLRPLAERLITFAKRGDLHARRQVMSVVRDKDVVHKLFAEIAPNFAERAGGYTRIVKVGPRKGDNAPMAVIELVEQITSARQTVREAERARGTKVAPRKAPSKRTAEIAEEAKAESPTAGAVAAAATTVTVPGAAAAEVVDTDSSAEADAAADDSETAADDDGGVSPEATVDDDETAVADDDETAVADDDETAVADDDETAAASVEPAASAEPADAPEAADDQANDEARPRNADTKDADK